MKFRGNWYILLFSFVLGVTFITNFGDRLLNDLSISVAEIAEEELTESEAESSETFISSPIKFGKIGGGNSNAIIEDLFQLASFDQSNYASYLKPIFSVSNTLPELYILYCALKLNL